MECMRHLIATDRQVEGNFTGYSSSLERVVLKKDRYLAAGLAAPGGPPEKSVPAASQQAVHAPARQPNPAPPGRGHSIFGDKLMQALRPAEAKRES